ncbi:hypothetical protein M0805_009479 [Coniferiporia weirii]|nr:hypothetical protein M0805_009479 [Coniferiporia weirii]
MTLRFVAAAASSGSTASLASTSTLRPHTIPSTKRLRLGAASSLNMTKGLSRRALSTGAGTHYDTLGVPRAASRMEIKASYFRLSKKYHPDARAHKADGGGGIDEKAAAEKFHAVSEAYAVLSSDRQRRAYDRTLGVAPTAAGTRMGASTSTGTGEASRWAYEMHERRRRGATHAWEGARTYRAHQHPHPHQQHAGMRHSGAAAHGRAYDPTSSSQSHPSASASPHPSEANVDKERWTPQPLRGRSAREEAERRAYDRVVRESSVGRFLRTVGIILVVSWIGGFGQGWGAG